MRRGNIGISNLFSKEYSMKILIALALVAAMNTALTAQSSTKVEVSCNVGCVINKGFKA
jgi:hypothetical protein